MKIGITCYPNYGGSGAVADDTLHARFSAAAPRYSVEGFSADRAVPMYEAHYLRVLESSS